MTVEFSRPPSPSAWRFQIPATRFFHQLFQFHAEDAQVFRIRIKRHLENGAKLSFCCLLGLYHQFCKLRFANVQPSQFGALASQSLFH